MSTVAVESKLRALLICRQQQQTAAARAHIMQGSSMAATEHGELSAERAPRGSGSSLRRSACACARERGAERPHRAALDVVLAELWIVHVRALVVVARDAVAAAVPRDDAAMHDRRLLARKRERERERERAREGRSRSQRAEGASKARGRERGLASSRAVGALRAEGRGSEGGPSTHVGVIVQCPRMRAAKDAPLSTDVARRRRRGRGEEVEVVAIDAAVHLVGAAGEVGRAPDRPRVKRRPSRD